MTKLQLFIEGVEVDLFKDEIVTVNSSVANVQDISKVFSDFSQSFLVPASPRNNAIFQHWYESDVVPTIDQNLRRDAFIEIETMPFRVGKIQLNEAVIKDGQVVSYSLNFFGALTSLKDRFGELQLKDLDYSSLNFTYNGQAVQDRLEDGTTSYDVRFPLISPKRFWNDIVGDADNIFEATKGISYRELFPAVRVSKIFDFIEAKFGITFNSTFFSSTRWTDLYFRNQLSETFNVLSNKHLVSFPNGSVPAPQSSQISINSTTSVITIKEEYRTEVEIINLTRSSGSAKLFVEVYRNNVLFSTTTVETGVTGLTIFVTAPSVAINDYQIYIYSDESITVNFDLRFTVSYESGSQFFDKAIVDPITLVVNDISGAFSSTIKIADFFSAILKTFNLVCVGENETTFTIEPLQDWYGLGTEKDITKYVLNSSGIKKVPLYKQISFSYKESKSFTNKNFLSLFNRQYGNLDSSFDYDGSEFKIELPFENNQFVEIPNTDLFCAYCIEENQSSYIPEPMLLYLAGEDTSTTAFKFKKESTEVNVTDYALFNSVNTTGFSLCFGNEFNIVTQETEPNSLYQTYYANHLGNLYDLQQRLFSFTAMLPTGVLANLKMNDKIIIKDKRYLINDISSTLNNGEVKMNLIRELVTIAPDCECIKVTYTLVGEEPVTVEINKINVGYDLWQFVLEEEPNLISIDLYYNAGHWVLHFVTVTATTGTNGLYYAFVENEGCPFVDFSEYELQEGYELNLESFIVEPCY
jgi:hypothetical protein